MTKKAYHWSRALGFLAAAMMLGSAPASTHGAPPTLPSPSRLVLIEQFTSTN